MKFKLTLIAGLMTAAIAATSAMGDGHANKAAQAAVKARQATMQLYAFNLGILGGMAKGEVDYNADAASAAAGNLAAIAGTNQMAMWIPGSDSDSVEGSNALPKIWQEGSTAQAKGAALGEASVAMASAAGEGLEALQGAIGAVGKSCGACHDNYRKPK